MIVSQCGGPMATIKQIRKIAVRVRGWTELKAEAAHYNPDNLCGWCAIASAELFTQLAAVGIVSEIHINSGHTFVIVDDNIVDITATQFPAFENTPVVIMHTKEVDEDIHWYYTGTKVFKSVKSLHAYQVKQQWPKHQRVLLTKQ